MDKAELLRRVHEGRARLEAALAEVPREQWTEPQLDNGWSFKDLMAHIGFWERHVHRILTTLQRDATLDPAYEATIDELNARVFRENRDRPLDEILRDERQAYEDVLALIETAPDADLFDPHRFTWTNGRPFVDWIEGNTYGHYEEHLEQLAASRED